ncbi:nucleotide exchange factor GrpE [Kitasatospora kifunensis]|uniref:Protein GrpE n=1 Tax=Kitasatospora kifunensis TaxID=58351 RepID=A0A7W7VYJ3_KITKI|nr:nucleotide exchange factor GrpE [Kitasatospora kifunensis]MBB4927762.1 molecular chaperone GrpE [Kitasatospora kifunensis]
MTGPDHENGGHLLGDAELPAGGGELGAGADHSAVVERELAERTADLQRLKADYDNYRKRVHRDRLAVREIAVANVLTALLPVLDTLDRAREHGELVGGLKAVADQLEAQLAALGLQSVGEPGEPFDPTRHEAVTQAPSTEVDRPTCTAVLRPGYRVGELLLRPAQVAVGEPAAPTPEPPQS